MPIINRNVEESARGTALNNKTFVNGNVNSSQPTTNNTAVETALSVNGLVAKVLVRQGTAAKIKWYKDGKPFTSLYTRNFAQADALAFINAVSA